MNKLRQPIVVFVGHIDHGKTSLLDKVRGSAITAGEAGGITQAISCSCVSLDVIKDICGELLKALKMEFTIPGLLFVDTPGHAAFNNIRKRGGNLADIAVLVIDVNDGVKPQTLECIKILKEYKTPFIIALNKVDLISGWQDKKGALLQVINDQPDSVKGEVEKKLYEVVGKLSEEEFDSDRFDRVDDFSKRIAIVPVSAKTGAGLPELLMVLTGLAQKFLEDNLKSESKEAKGTIMEVKEETGFGKTMDVIIYDGSLKKGDTIVVGSLGEPIVTKVRGLFEPVFKRGQKCKFKSVNDVSAAIGVKILAPNVDDAVAGMPIVSCEEKDVEKVKKEISTEIESVVIHTETNGIIVKADSLGSLEALIILLKEKDIPIRKATIGNITKKDVAEAESMKEEDPLLSVVIGFNVALEGKDEKKVKIITNDVVYKLIEEYEKWKEEELNSQEGKELESLVRPCKLTIMSGYVFRQNNPAVVGVDVMEGIVKNNTPLMKEDGKEITTIKSMQLDQDNVEKAERGKKVAISLPNVTVGRQINEGDVLYSAIPEEDFRKLKELKKHLKPAEIKILKEIAVIMRKKNEMWGV